MKILLPLESLFLSEKGTLTSQDLLKFSATTLCVLLTIFIIRVLKSNKILSEHKKKLEKQYEEIKEQYETLVRIKEDVRAGKKFELAVKSASDQIIITDSEGIILYANPAVEQISGFDPIRVLGKKAGSKDLWGGQMEKDFYKKFWKAIKEEKKSFMGTFENKKKDGTTYYAQTTVSPVLDENGNVSFFVGIERDITKEKEVEKLKDDFVSLVSHQMRTPLSAIKWYLESLIDESIGSLNKEQKVCAIDMYNSNQRMIDLVNTLLNTSKIESGRIVINSEPTDVKKLVTEVIKEAENRIFGRDCKIKLNIEENLPLILLDSQLIRNVYLNVITNALKYSPKDNPIEVTIYKEKGNLISKIADQGYGIPEEDQKKIFTKFYRGSNASKAEPSGTGLGLYLAKNIVESSGGKIWFESTPKKGTVFWISIPLM
jgi:two-component system sensor histidine kinase VicK